MTPESKTCPNCGHCDKCGRSNFHPQPWYPTWVYPYWSVQPPYSVGDFPNTSITGITYTSNNTNLSA